MSLAHPFGLPWGFVWAFLVLSLSALYTSFWRPFGILGASLGILFGRPFWTFLGRPLGFIGNYLSSLEASLECCWGVLATTFGCSWGVLWASLGRSTDVFEASLEISLGVLAPPFGPP